MPPKKTNKGKNKTQQQQRNQQYAPNYKPQSANNYQRGSRKPAANPIWQQQTQSRPQFGPRHGGQPSVQPQAQQAWHLAKNQRASRPMTVAEFVAQSQDSQAKTQWREREDCKQTVSIPDELFLSTEHLQEYEVIAAKHGAFIFHKRSNSFGLWGSHENAKAAKQGISAWVQREQESKSTSRTTFAKQRSFTPAVKEQQRKLFEREVKRYEFRQRPAYGEKFGSHGSFIWPDDIGMQTALGPGLEMLDRIRMDCQCYIFVGKDGFTIDALGSLENVASAIERVRTVYFQVKARELVASRNYLIFWKTPDMAETISASAVWEDLPGGHHDDSDAFILYRGQDWDHGSDQPTEQSVDTLRRLQAVIMNTVRQIRYYPGHIQFKVRMSHFLGVQYLPATDGYHTLDDFKAMISQSQFVGQCAIGMGNKNLEADALGRLKLAEHLLQPQDNMIKELFDTTPVYTAIFHFEDAGSTFQLEMQWTEDSWQNEKMYAPSGKRWTKLDSLSHEATKLIDTHVLNMQHGTTWHFQMTAGVPVTDEATLPPRLLQFADKIKFNQKTAEADSFEPPFVYAVPEASLRSLEQIKTWKFSINQSDYSVELSQHQRREYIERRPALQEPRWSVAVTNSDWAKMLAENEAMPVGQGVSWASEAAVWFPRGPDAGENDQTAGLKTLMHTLEVIQDLLWQESVDESTGMQIG